MRRPAAAAHVPLKGNPCHMTILVLPKTAMLLSESLRLDCTSSVQYLACPAGLIQQYRCATLVPQLRSELAGGVTTPRRRSHVARVAASSSSIAPASLRTVATPIPQSHGVYLNPLPLHLRPTFSLAYHLAPSHPFVPHRPPSSTSTHPTPTAHHVLSHGGCSHGGRSWSRQPQ